MPIHLLDGIQLRPVGRNGFFVQLPGDQSPLRVRLLRVCVQRCRHANPATTAVFTATSPAASATAGFAIAVTAARAACRQLLHQHMRLCIGRRVRRWWPWCRILSLVLPRHRLRRLRRALSELRPTTVATVAAGAIAPADSAAIGTLVPKHVLPLLVRLLVASHVHM